MIWFADQCLLFLQAVIQQFWQALLTTVPVLLLTAAVFTILGIVGRACNSTGPWWRKRGLTTDLAYVAIMPGLFGYLRIMLLSCGVALFYHLHDQKDLGGFFAAGHGPLSHLPLDPQVPVYLLLADLVLYATHRLLHSRSLWLYHAIHHSSEDVEWLSSNRIHPVDLAFHSVLADVVPLLLGISPDVLMWLLPFNIGMSALAHANLDWSYGPFRYVIVSPMFHRWHHTSPRQGGSCNFSGNFPFLDVIFGTFYMPRDRRPERYGAPGVPGNLAAQMLHPFKHRRHAADQTIIRR